MKAVILAAGKGTRMQGLTSVRPKPMLELCGKPMLEHIIVSLRNAGISDFAIVTGYLAESIENHFQDGRSWGIQVRYIRQTAPNGTGAALHLAKDLVGQEPFFGGFGDIITSLENYPALITEFLTKSCDATISLNWVEDPCRGACVYLDDRGEFVADIIEKPVPGTSTSHWNNAGLMVFTPLLFDYTARLKPSARGEYELTDAIGAMLADQRRVRGFKLRGFWSDVGRPEDLDAANQAICGSQAIETSAVALDRLL